jgi:hypothetical protein
MFRNKMFSICWIILLVGVSQGFSTENDVKLTPIGYGSLEVGQIVNGYFKQPANMTTNQIDHVWQQQALSLFGYKAQIQDHLEIQLVGGGMLAYSTPQIGTHPTTLQTHQLFFIQNAFATYSFNFLDDISAQLQLGYFPYKYNADARNLGEYLFRTNTYPLIVYSDFDYPQADLLGVRANVTLFNRLVSNDLLLHSEVHGVPVQLWSVSDIVSSDLSGIVNLSAGISFAHYLDVYQGNGYLNTWADRFYGDPRKLDPQNKVYYIDTIYNGTDTSYFSWKAIKAMFRFSFDPKKFIPLDIFGKNDLKLYAEGDIIGIKNYVKYYRHIEDRTLATAGFNLPGFKFIDCISLEGEYCANRIYAYSDERYYSLTPVPLPIRYADINLSRNPWRWSVYIKKSLFNEHVSFIAQAARDHKKINFHYFDRTNMSFIETLPDGDNWWWTFKTEFKF